MRFSAALPGLALADPACAHSDSKSIKGPQGGHIIDAGGGKQHWELVARGNQLTLYVLDGEEKPVTSTARPRRARCWSATRLSTSTLRRPATTF